MNINILKEFISNFDGLLLCIKKHKEK